MRLVPGHPRLPCKKQFHELFAERLLDIGCGVGRARRVQEPDDGRVLLDGLNCDIERLIYQSNRQCLGTHCDQVGPELLQLLAVLRFNRPGDDLFVWEKLVERSDRRSGACCNIAHRSRVISHFGEDWSVPLPTTRPLVSECAGAPFLLVTPMLM